MATLRLVLITLFAALVLAFAPSAGAIVNGTVDTRDKYSYVVFVTETTPPPGTRIACTGTLLAPRVVVTAGHCSRADGAPMQVRLGVEAVPGNPANFYSGTFVRHPGFCAGTPIAPCTDGLFGFVANDLAVITLDRDAPGPYAKLPRANRFDGNEDKGEDLRRLTIVGYGLTQAPPPVVGFGTRRFAKAQVHVAPGAPTFLEYPPLTSDRYGMHCFGDSGGPSLRGRTILAVTSIGDDSCRGPSYAYRLDTDSARSFLANYISTKGGRGGGDDEREDEDDD
jgi:secreted trypsin-like serine protease